MPLEYEVIKDAVQSRFGLLVLVVMLAISVITKLIDLGVIFIKGLMDKRFRVDGISRRDHVNNVLTDMLESVLVSTGGCRIQVVEFTNTVKNLASVPFVYMTVTYEAFVLGRSSASHTCQNELTSLYAPFLTELRSKRCVMANVADTSSLSKSVAPLLTRRGVSRSLYVGVMDSVGRKMLGYISVDGDEGSVFGEAERSKMVALADKLGVLLSLGKV
jgi:hypothetical protein